MLYTPIMVSYTHQINGLLDALNDKGAAIVQARIVVRRLVDMGMISKVAGMEILEALQTDAAVSSPQSS